MSVIVQRDDLEQENQLQVVVEPSRLVSRWIFNFALLTPFIFLSISCKTKEEDTDSLCEWNPQVPFRFYEINVKATDFGGQVTNTTATVVMVPKMESKDAASKKTDQGGVYEKYLTYATKESKRYLLESMTLDWNIIWCQHYFSDWDKG